jgi:NADH:ubiquinone oxidoreductase subunit 6 (subunit J)
MHPILFWTLGGLALLASLAVLLTRRPARAVVGLLLVLGLDAGLVLGLGAPLLALELAVAVLGAGLVTWALILRPGRLRLGAPGRTRLDVSRLVAMGVTCYLGILLVWAIGHSPDAEPASPAGLAGGFAGWAAGALLGGAAVTAYVVLGFWRGRAPDAEGGG